MSSERSIRYAQRVPAESGRAGVPGHGGRLAPGSTHPGHAEIFELQRTVGNRTVGALLRSAAAAGPGFEVQRSPGRDAFPAFKKKSPFAVIDMCVEGDIPVPRSLADAIQRRQIDPAAPRRAEHLPHYDFLQWLDTQHLDRPDRARLEQWSLEVHYGHLERERRRNLEGENLVKGPYGQGRTDPRDPSKFARPRRRGEWLESFVVGGVEYVVDLGRGALHVGRYGKASIVAVWDPAELKQLTKNDIAFFALILRLFTDPAEVVRKIGTGYSAALAARHWLTPEQEEQVKRAASGAIPDLVKELIGKHLTKQLLISAVVGPVLNKLSGKVTSEVLKRGMAKAKGAPLLILSVLGMLEKAGTAATRLEEKYPVLYRYLEPDDLQIAWFLVEEPLEDVREELVKQIREQLDRPPLR